MGRRPRLSSSGAAFLLLCSPKLLDVETEQRKEIQWIQRSENKNMVKGGNAVALTLPRKGSYRSVISVDGLAIFCIVLAVFAYLSSRVLVVGADNFVDIFYTNSFRGSFEWFKKLDWIGMLVQAVISIFSLVGVSLIVMRVMTSLLYLSAKGLWEEVHDLKQGGGESEMFDFGFVNMAKSWAKGKAGTGLDAIFGAVLILLPDVKKYSDFGEKSGNKFDDDTTMTQYVLKILLPTVMAVFFLAMGFNGTLVKGLAVTVDAMGTFADKCVSVNYSGFVEDLVNSGTGYKFTFAAAGTEQGKLQESMAKDIYGRVVSSARGASTSQLQQIGINIESAVADNFDGWVDSSTQISEKVRTNLGGENGDRFYSYLGFEVIPNTSTNETAGQVGQLLLSELLEGTGLVGSTTDSGDAYEQVYHIYIRQTNSFDGSYFNVDEVGT